MITAASYYLKHAFYVSVFWKRLEDSAFIRKSPTFYHPLDPLFITSPFDKSGGKGLCNTKEVKNKPRNVKNFCISEKKIKKYKLARLQHTYQRRVIKSKQRIVGLKN